MPQRWCGMLPKICKVILKLIPKNFTHAYTAIQNNGWAGSLVCDARYLYMRIGFGWIDQPTLKTGLENISKAIDAGEAL